MREHIRTLGQWERSMSNKYTNFYVNIISCFVISVV